MKILGFSKDIGSSVSLLPSFMHRLENLLVATELKQKLSASFPEGAEIGAERVGPYCCDNILTLLLASFMLLVMHVVIHNSYLLVYG